MEDNRNIDNRNIDNRNIDNTNEEKPTKFVKKIKPNINNEADIPKIKEKLKDYLRIEERHVKLIPSYTKVRYINRETGDFSQGGLLLKYDKENDRILFKMLNPKKRFVWYLDYKKYIIFIEDLNERDRIRVEKDNLYKLYKSGFLKIVYFL